MRSPTRSPTRSPRPKPPICGAVSLALLLTGCAAEGTPKPDESALFISPDFGQALHQDIAAQIADPDAHYRGMSAPGSNGSRVALAQHRYVRGKVIQPSSIGASTVAGGGAGEGASGDNGQGGGADAGPPPAPVGPGPGPGPQ